MAENRISSHTDILQAAKSEFCVYIQTADVYFYLMVPGTKMLPFKTALHGGNVNLKNFGTVIARGEGNPPASVKRTMEFEFGCNHDDAVEI